MLSWLKEHIYVPIIAGIVVGALLVILFVYLCKKCRHSMRYDYTQIKEDLALPEKLNNERRRKENFIRDRVNLACQLYLRSNSRFEMVDHLYNIGSRSDKHFFTVSDRKLHNEQLLLLVPYSSKMVLPFTKNTFTTLTDLFSIIQHPYIFPVVECDFSTEQNCVIVYIPVNLKGSLKDLIYQAKWTDSWQTKYSMRSRGLTTKQIQMFGRQILEGMIFLQEKGFPPHGHLHSGNILISKNKCEIAGYENTFFGLSSKLFPLLKKKLKESSLDAIDSISFGHIIFEMCVGHELDTAHPEPHHLVTCQNPQVVDILNFIFENDGQYPSIQQIARHEFFKNVKCPELEVYNPSPINFTPAMKNLLKNVRKGKLKKLRSKSRTSEDGTNRHRKGRKQSSASSIPETPSSSKFTTQASLENDVFSAAVVPPPPPPPPPPPTPPASVKQTVPQTSERSALLKSIRDGKKLKKAQTVDRSAPLL